MNRGGRRPVDLGILIFFLALVGIFYRQVTTLFFSQDDLLFLLRAADHLDWPPDYPLRRLLSVRLFFDTTWNLFGTDPAPYHWVALSLHGLNSWLCYRLAGRLGLRKTPAFLAGFLFAVAPVSFTCLHWISGIQDIMLGTFSLLTALSLTGKRWTTDLLALICYILAMLSKEAALLLLPVLVLILPMEKQRRIRLLVIGLTVGMVLLVGVGGWQSRPAGDPYAMAYGSNIIFNLLTYLAWLVRPWDFFPDRLPQWQTALWGWGLILPVIFGLLIRLRPAWRPAMFKAAAVFMALLLPILPLTRHSYLYYLHVPLIPIWILMAAGLGRIPHRFRNMALLVPILLMLLTTWQGDRRFELKIGEALQADSNLRYGALAKTAVADLAGSNSPVGGEMIILSPFLAGAVDLAQGLHEIPGGTKRSFLPIERALHGGEALRLFFPQVQSVRFIEDFEPRFMAGLDWQNSEIYFTWGAGHLHRLGRGVAGRREYADILFAKKAPARARRELEAILQAQPENPDHLRDLGIFAVQTGDWETVRLMEERLTEMAAADTDPEATFFKALLTLKRVIDDLAPGKLD